MHSEMRSLFYIRAKLLFLGSVSSYQLVNTQCEHFIIYFVTLYFYINKIYLYTFLRF